MGSMAFGRVRAPRTLALPLAAALLAATCGGGVFKQEYEYEEELYLYLDGSATINVNASVASLVALRGAPLDVDPRARLDRDAVREYFGGSGAAPRVTLSRRDGRRFVHVRIDVDDVRRISERTPFAWSSYAFDRRDDVFEFRQVVGPPAGAAVGNVGWDGEELVAFRMHLPSEIVFNNTPIPVQRGNILEWEQPLRDRLEGARMDLQVHLETESILYTTLLLFGSTIAAAALAFAAVVWWFVRRGRQAEVVEQRS